MARKFKVFGTDIIIGKRLFGLGRDNDNYFSIMSQRYGTNMREHNYLKSYKGIVYSCISLIGEQCGGYKPFVYKQVGDKIEKVKDHGLIQLLENPTSDADEADSTSMYDLFEATGAFLMLQGEVFWYTGLGTQSGLPREITMLRADKVGIDLDEKGNVAGYFIRRNMGDPIPIQVNEMLHFKLFNPLDAYRGMGRVEGANDYIQTDEYSSQFTKNFFGNNAGLSGVLSIKGEVTRGAFKKFVRAWREKYQGVDNAGKTAIIRDTEAAFTKIGLGLDELDMSSLRKMTKEDVTEAFRVPLPLLGHAEQTGLGRANVEALEYIFAKYNIDQIMQRFDAMMKFALRRYWKEPTLYVGHESIIPSDKEYELNEIDKGVDRWITRNEIRDEMGRPSIDGGDGLFVPINQLPLDESGGTDPAADDNSGKGLTIKIKRKVHVKTGEPAPDGEKKKTIRVTTSL